MFLLKIIFICILIYRNFDFCNDYGYSALMTPFVWMFIKNYELCRKYNRYSFESSCSLPEPPDFINGISSMINCLKNNTNYKLIQKEVIHLINKKNKLICIKL